MYYFGTDGIRGNARIFTHELLKKVAYSLIKMSQNKRFVIARDTRESGGKIEKYLAKSLSDMGGIVYRCGIVPTPVCAYITAKRNVDFGIMITASHNPPEYNGIKILNSCGEKPDSYTESTLDELIFSLKPDKSAKSCETGQIIDLRDVVEEYTSFVLKNHSDGFLKSLRVVLDTANGATYKIAPYIFKKAGADVDVIFAKNDGKNINVNSGATHLESLCEKMHRGEYDIGFAFDGDGDRVIAIKNGKILDGDHIAYILAKELKTKGKLNKNTVVLTKTANYGVESALIGSGINVKRVDVGDKFVLEEMKNKGYSVGSEASGHIIIGEKPFTGDGIKSALILSEIALKDDILMIDDVVEYPQFSKNIALNETQAEEILQRLSLIDLAGAMDDSGIKLIVRKSGTENLIRVIVQGKDELKTEFALEFVCSIIEKSASLGK